MAFCSVTVTELSDQSVLISVVLCLNAFIFENSLSRCLGINLGSITMKLETIMVAVTSW